MTNKTELKYNYSIAYPDKENIKYIEQPKSKDEIVRIIQEFDWDKELKKEIKFYSPSIDLINFYNRKRIIFSGIGNNKLSEFQVMYIEPKSNYSKKVFDESNYLHTKSFTKTLSIDEADEILDKFFVEEYSRITKQLVLDTNSTEKQENTFDKKINDREELSIYMQLFLAFVAPLLTLTTFLVGFKLYEFENELNSVTILIFSTGILFSIATYKIWQRIMKKSNT